MTNTTFPAPEAVPAEHSRFVKDLARARQQASKQAGRETSLARERESMSRELGFRDWNAFSNSIESGHCPDYSALREAKAPTVSGSTLPATPGDPASEQRTFSSRIHQPGLIMVTLIAAYKLKGNQVVPIFGASSGHVRDGKVYLIAGSPPIHGKSLPANFGIKPETGIAALYGRDVKAEVSLRFNEILKMKDGARFVSAEYWVDVGKVPRGTVLTRAELRESKGGIRSAVYSRLQKDLRDELLDAIDVIAKQENPKAKPAKSIFASRPDLVMRAIEADPDLSLLKMFVTQVDDVSVGQRKVALLRRGIDVREVRQSHNAHLLMPDWMTSKG